MNELLNLFSSFTITEEYPYRGYLSEISSPSRIWLQIEDPELLKLCDDIDEFYKANHQSKSLEINENDLKVGAKIAAFICGKWNRATILSDITQKGNVCIFADDFGTKGYLNLKYCRILAEDFIRVPRKSVRACLYGVMPPENKLFDIDATDFIVKFCYNRLFRFKFVMHHAEEDFHEIIACRDDGEILNNHLVTSGYAKPPISENSKFSVFYPSFELLENSQFYESYNHRYIYKKRGINFNAFEEEFIKPGYPYEEQLFSLLACDKFGAVKKVFESLRA